MSRYLRTFTSLLFVLCSSVLFSACSEKAVAPPLPQIISLEVFPSPASVRVGEDLVMVAKVVADSGADRSLTWRSSDPRRVTVTQTGILTGVAVGPAVITVSADADPSLVSVVTVNVGPRYTGVQNIVASPTSMSLLPGQTQGMTVTVSADPGISRSVTFASDDPAVATVSSAGVVTAVAAGSARITARSVADTSATTAIPVTVRTPTAARVSIQSITSRGTGLPVDLLNVHGQIDVVVNIEPGESRLSRVDLVVTNNGRDTVVASQQFTALQAEALEAQAALKRNRYDTFGRPLSASTLAALSVIVQSFRSDAFNPTNGTVAFRNAPTTLRAVAVDITPTGTSQQSASSTVTAQLNNRDGFVADVRALSTTGFPSAIDANGRRWLQAGRGLVFTTTPVMYSGRTLGTRTISFPGGTPLASINTTKSGVSIDTLLLPANFVSATANEGYLNGELPSINASDATGNALNLVPALPTGNGYGIINVQPTYTSGPRLEGIRVDNAPPPAPTLVLSATQNNSNNWINGAYRFDSGLSGLAPDVGVGLIGNAATPTVASAALSFFAVGGDLTDTTEVVTGAELPASNTNAQYDLLLRFSDRLGNTRVVTLSGAGVHPGTKFGVDLLAPTLRYTDGSLVGKTLVSTNSDSVFANATGSLGARAFGVDAIDDRSGLQDGRVAVTVKRFAQPSATGTFSGTTTCIVGTGTTCEPVLRPYEATLPDQYRQVSQVIDGGSGLDGYFHFSATAQDQAGNLSNVVTRRALIDGGVGLAAPQMTGLGVSGVLLGGQSAAISVLASDNVELWRGGVLLQYPNLPGISQMLAYGTPFEGGTTIGVAFDSLLSSPIAGTHPAFTIPRFIRGLEIVDGTDAPPPYAQNTVKPTAANAWVTDFAVGSAPSTLLSNVAILPGSVESAGTAPGYRAANGTPRELRFWRRVAGISALRFEAIGPSGQVVSPFTRVLLLRQESSLLPVNTTVWRIIAEQTAPTGLDNGLARSWTYDFGFPPTGSTYLAVGVNATGDAIATQIVPF